MGDGSAMRWFRLHQKWGTCFELAALLIQLGVCAGHVHVGLEDHDYRHVEYAGAPTDTHGRSAAAAHEHEQDDDSPGAPHAPDRNHCAVCALIHLAQSFVTPTAPVLAQPDLVDHRPVSEPPAALTAQHPALFQARAPPIA
jgi:hypothetical protein